MQATDGYPPLWAWLSGARPERRSEGEVDPGAAAEQPASEGPIVETSEATSDEDEAVEVDDGVEEMAAAEAEDNEPEAEEAVPEDVTAADGVDAPEKHDEAQS